MWVYVCADVRMSVLDAWQRRESVLKHRAVRSSVSGGGVPMGLMMSPLPRGHGAEVGGT